MSQHSQHLIDAGREVGADDYEGNSRGGRNGARGGGTRLRTASAPRAAPGASPDATLDALEALGSALEEMATDAEMLRSRLDQLKHERAAGRSWRDILGDEDPPGTMQIVSRMLACLAKASGTLRKELVDSLRQEGVSIPAIAKLFGVTHQRVSNLLRRPAAS